MNSWDTLTALAMTACTSLALPAPAGATVERAQAQVSHDRPLSGGRGDQNDMRFRGMDRDHDGVITRAEWRGDDRSFRNQDWNGDGVLSGEEVRPGGRREQRVDPDDEYGRSRKADRDRRPFRDMDRNDDAVISHQEWPGDHDEFNRLDKNRDGVITPAEYSAPDNDVYERFANLDHDHDGVLVKEEWHGDRPSFERADWNRDGVITLQEFRDVDPESDQRPEHPAYRAGYSKGLQEGRAAGREDRERRQGWDLEGQRELEGADSGFEPRIGSIEDYRAGYRVGFRRGYPEGYGPRP